MQQHKEKKASVLITGGSGFIGRQVCRAWLDKGYECTILSRQPPRTIHALLGNKVTVINHVNQLDAQSSIDVVINLAGAGVADARWSERRKHILKQSRIDLSVDLIHQLLDLKQPVTTFISASAIGYYGDQENQEVDEETPPNDCFSHQLCQQWEQSVAKITQAGTRLCIVRIGLVIGQGGFLKRLLLPFKLGLGGEVGNGKQWMSWISLNDLLAIFEFLQEQDALSGVFNATAPHPVTNAQFTKALSDHLNRIAVLRQPSWLLTTLLGEMSELLLKGSKVHPKRLLKAGFSFADSELEQSLKRYV